METATTKRGINEQDVWRAADALLQEGARPTIERVRQKIGRGSPNTVSPYLDRWFGSLGQRIKDPEAFTRALEIPDPVTLAAQQVWAAAMATARAQLGGELASQAAALEADRQTLAEERAELAAATERLASQALAREETIQLLRAQLAGETERLTAIAGQHAQAVHDLDAARQQIVQLRGQCDALRSDADKTRQANEKHRAEAERRAVENEKRWQLEVDRARQELKAAVAKQATIEREAAARGEKLAAALEQAEARHRRDLEEAGKREVAQRERLERQLAKALTNLEAAGKEHGALLRSLVKAGGRAKGSHARK